MIPYAPHLLMPQWMDDADPAQRKLAMQMGLEMIGRVDELWLCSEKIRAGMRDEIEYAEKHGVPVITQEYLLKEHDYEPLYDMN